jgi:hypothetical protein
LSNGDRERTSRVLVWSLLLQFLKQRKLSPPRFQARRRRRRAVWRTRRHDGQGQPLSVAASGVATIHCRSFLIYYRINIVNTLLQPPSLGLSSIILRTLELGQQLHWRMPVFCFACPQSSTVLLSIHLNHKTCANSWGSITYRELLDACIARAAEHLAIITLAYAKILSIIATLDIHWAPLIQIFFGTTAISSSSLILRRILVVVAIILMVDITEPERLLIIPPLELRQRDAKRTSLGSHASPRSSFKSIVELEAIV